MYSADSQAIEELQEKNDAVPAGDGTKMSPDTAASRTSSCREVAASAGADAADASRGNSSVSQAVACGSSSTSRHARLGRTCGEKGACNVTPGYSFA